MSSNDALSDRQMLEKIKGQLERQEKTARLRFRFAVAITFIVLSLSVLLASLSLGKTIELRWFSLPLLFVGLLTIYVSLVEFSQEYRKNFIVSGSILLIIGVLTVVLTSPTLVTPFSFISYQVRAVAGWVGVLLMLSGIVLIFLPLRRVAKEGRK
jgi:uncharacterized membrane protein